MEFSHVSVGKGKGVAAFLDAQYIESDAIKTQDFQMASYKSKSRYLINIYASQKASSSILLSNLGDVLDSIDYMSETFIFGDFNICYKTESNHAVVKHLLDIGFQQLVEEPTHSEGRLLDHVYVRNPSSTYTIFQHSLPYLDHDMIHVIEST